VSSVQCREAKVKAVSARGREVCRKVQQVQPMGGVKYSSAVCSEW